MNGKSNYTKLELLSMSTAEMDDKNLFLMNVPVRMRALQLRQKGYSEKEIAEAIAKNNFRREKQAEND